MTGLPAYVEFRGDFSKLGKEVMAKVKPMSSQFGKLAVSQSKATRTTGLLDRGTGRLGGSLARAAKYAIGAGAAYLSIAKAKEAVSTTLELSKATTGLNRNLGLSVNVSSRWAAVAKARGIDNKSMTMSFTILGKRMVDAAHKGGTTMEAFNRLGISQADVEKGSKDFGFGVMRVAKAFGEAEGGAKRQASAQQLLGRGYATILPLFSEGTKSLKEQLHWADEFGVTLSGKTNDSLMELVQAQRKSKMATLGLEVAFTKMLTPALTAAEGKYQDLVRIFARKDLTDSQKWAAVGKEIEHLADDGLEAFDKVLPEIADHVGAAAPKIAKTFLDGFLHSDTWGRLALGTFLISRFGGLGAFAAIGTRAGAAMGIGMSEGAVAGMAGGATVGAADVGAAAVGGGLAARVGGVLKSIRWGRIGAAGAGLALADEIMNEVSRRMDERSPDLTVSLDAKGHQQDIVSWAREHLSLGPYINQFFGEADVEKEKSAAKHILSRYEEMQHMRIRMREVGIQTIRQDAQSLDLTTDQRKELGRMVELLQRGKALKTNVDIGMDPEKLRQIQHGFSFLKQGVGTNLADINRVTQRTGHLIIQTFGKNTAEGRKLTATNMRATAKAIETEMERSGHKTKVGMDRIHNLIANAKLLDPTRKQAHDFGAAWAAGMSHSKDVTRDGVKDMIREANKMPGPMRQVALKTWLEQIKQAKRSGDITAEEFRKMRSRVLSEFGTLQTGSKQKSKGVADGVIGNITRLVNTTGSGLTIFKENVNAALDSFGVKTQQFEIKAFQGGGGRVERQSGGIVPGTGDGDKFKTRVPVGSFVLNREATAAFGFRNGGMVPVALEAGERWFHPDEVRSIGRPALEGMNASVPRRLQHGGGVGGSGPEPRLLGPDPLRSLGQNAIHRVYEGGKAYLKKHSPALGVGVKGSVKDHPELQPGISAIVATILKRWPGLAITSTTSGGHAENSLHYEGRAADLAAASGYMLDAAGWIKANLTPALTEGIHNPNLSVKYGKEVSPGFWGSAVWGDHLDHIHVGKQLGGLVQALVKGGWVKTGYTTYDVDGPGAFGDLMKGMGYAELGAATSSGGGTGTGFIAKALGMSGELPKDFPLEVKIGSIGKVATLFKRDRGYGQGDPYYSTDIHHLAWSALGLTGNNKGDAFIRPADGAASTHAAAPMPKQAGFGFKGGTTGAGGGTNAPGRGKVSLEKLPSFGSLPDNLRACRKELAQRRSELAQYRQALSQTKASDERKALETNIELLRARIRALLKQQGRLLVKKVRERAVSKIEGRGAFPEIEELLRKREGDYNLAEQFAEQVVGLEPEENAGAYVSSQEEPAFSKVLGAEAGWRNAVIHGENLVTMGISKMLGQIEGIEALKTKHRPAYNKQKFRIPALKKALASARELFDPAKKSGTLEDTLINLQGYGGSHDPAAVLPALPVAGKYGGLIWDTQESIRGLGLKLKEGEGTSDRTSLLEELLRQANQRTILAQTGFDVLRGFMHGGMVMPYIGKAHTGAIVPGPPTQESMVTVQGGEGIFTQEQMAAIGGSSAGDVGVEVHVHGDILSKRSDPVEVVLGDRRFAPAVQRHARGGRGVGIATPGGARR
jgi:hypothetical protein